MFIIYEKRSLTISITSGDSFLYREMYLTNKLEVNALFFLHLDAISKTCI